MNECVCLNECLTLAAPRPLAEWHEEMGPMLWWCWEPPESFEQISDPATYPAPRIVKHGHDGRWLGEAPYCGSPNDIGREIAIRTVVFEMAGETVPYDGTQVQRVNVGGWPGYHTHFTPIPMPEAPK